MSYRVSALIPCYQMADRVGEAVDSVVGQAGEAVEIIVIDDGSTDDPGAALAQFGDRVRLVRQENAGVSAARNRGAAEATGEWLAFLDADDRWLPQRTVLSLQAADACPDAGLVYGQALGSGDDGRSALLGVAPDGIAADGDIRIPLLLTGNLVPTLTCMVRRDLFHAVGGFDTSIPAGEDYDLWLRLCEHRTAAYVGEPIALYHMHDGGDLMGDLERWSQHIDSIHDAVLARHPGDAAIRAAVDVGRARVRLARGRSRLQRGDRRGAREDLRSAATCAQYADEAKRLLRHAMIPGPVYRSLRALRG